jgi:hypothetical protein
MKINLFQLLLAAAPELDVYLSFSFWHQNRFYQRKISYLFQLPDDDGNDNDNDDNDNDDKDVY